MFLRQIASRGYSGKLVLQLVDARFELREGRPDIFSFRTASFATGAQFIESFCNLGQLVLL